ncbi:hypothetical protein [Pseudonocardia pini]|uniref:hypothetical protein n=1 Tax=Pseudonocardia pini TaxID=2758030 RepID=UPI0015F0335E|nr:hypothetical protein [Pseudonocardia pini]
MRAPSFPSARSWRALLVSIHVIASVCWLGLAIALVALLGLSLSSPPGETRTAAAAMAHELDLTVLGFAAMIAALSGFALSTATSWGWFQYRWVSTKVVLTLGQIALGTAVLGQALPGVATAAGRGTHGAALPVAVGLGLVATGLALQVWLSVAKPGGRTRWGRRAPGRLPTAPAWVFALMVGLPLIDTALHAFGVADLPVLSAIGLVAVLIARSRAASATARPSRVARSARSG